MLFGADAISLRAIAPKFISDDHYLETYRRVRLTSPGSQTWIGIFVRASGL
jgi:hypothetical protein